MVKEGRTPSTAIRTARSADRTPSKAGDQRRDEACLRSGSLERVIPRFLCASVQQYDITDRGMVHQTPVVSFPDENRVQQ